MGQRPRFCFRSATTSLMPTSKTASYSGDAGAAVPRKVIIIMRVTALALRVLYVERGLFTLGRSIRAPLRP